MHDPSAMLRHRSHADDIVHRTQDLIDDRLAEPLPLAYLAAGAGVSERTLTRLFGHATCGLTPLIKDLAARGITVVIVAHDLAFAREVAHRVLFMEAGYLLDEQPPRTHCGS